MLIFQVISEFTFLSLHQAGHIEIKGGKSEQRMFLTLSRHIMLITEK